MFCDFGIKSCNKFLSSTEFRELKTKRERICNVLQRFDLNHLIRTASDRILEISKKNRKCFEIAEHYLKCADMMYRATADGNEGRLKNTIKNASMAIVNAPFGEETFVKGYELRSKCFVRLHENSQALSDIEVAIKFGGNVDPKRVLIKAIILFLKNQFKPLKDYLRSLNIRKNDLFTNFDDSVVLSELGLTHLTYKYLLSFVEDPNFATRTTKSDNAMTPSSENYMEQVTKFMVNYNLDNRCKIKNDSYKGRHFMAEGYIPKGSVILVERSYSLTLDKESQLEFCLFCHKACKSFIPCKHCTEAIFCSFECLNYGWKISHRFECTLLSIFKDSFNVSLHMYRTIASIGVEKALLIEKDLRHQREEQLKLLDDNESSSQNAKKAKNQVYDQLINDYLEDETLRETVNYRQTLEQTQKVYRMNQTLLDHNETYEDYYDVCYMGVSIDVSLLHLLHMFLSTDDEQLDQNLIWDRLYSKQPQSVDNLMDDTPFLSSTISDFISLISIIQVNIRKLVTNVFSWNIYDESYQVKKSIATCQCLVGSLINHSCDPNVEWDFKNGCIVYTTTRNIEKGEEINNSYGPHRSTPFIERQNLLASNYYFNCRCSICREEVVNHPHVLACLLCAGPVVCLSEIVVNATCMNCHSEYVDIQHRMKKINQMRIKFKSLFHFFHDQPYGGSNEISDELATYFNELIEMMDYQLKYCYIESQHLQSNLQTFCRLLYRLGKHEHACQYGLYQRVNREYSSTPRDSDRDQSFKSMLSQLENSTFWFQLYLKFIRQYGDNNSKRTSFYDGRNLLSTAKDLMDHHFETIQTTILNLLKTQENDEWKKPIVPMSANEELNHLDFINDSTNVSMDGGNERQLQHSSGVPYVKLLLSDVLHWCSTQYSIVV
ncbi:hypothetical protein BLOT_001269 [Blomia tropicalis]|nr:hypothetical protein BLOT_001269 [Blomia tropicalis]